MSNTTIFDLSETIERVTLIDVRKPLARIASGQTIPQATWRHPFDAENWRHKLDPNKPVVVFCVHGHEVSQSVCGFLKDHGFDARFLEGGFEAWKDNGNQVVSINEQ